MKTVITFIVFVVSALICGYFFEAGHIGGPVVFFWGACTVFLDHIIREAL